MQLIRSERHQDDRKVPCHSKLLPSSATPRLECDIALDQIDDETVALLATKSEAERLAIA